MIRRVAGWKRTRPFDQPVVNGIEKVAMHEHPLHADAALAGLVKCAECQAVDDAIKLAGHRFVDDAGGISTQFKMNALLAGFGLELPADLVAAGEAEQGDALIAHQRLGRIGHGGQDAP